MKTNPGKFLWRVVRAVCMSCLLLAVTSPLINASALGLGELRPLSALGQPFVAYVEVYVSPAEDERNLSVQLAPLEAYEDRGQEYPFLSRSMSANFIKQHGSWFVLLESDQAINNPIVTVILKATSERGSVYRQYDLLLDPSERLVLETTQEELVSKSIMEVKSPRLVGLMKARPKGLCKYKSKFRKKTQKSCVTRAKGKRYKILTLSFLG